VVQGIDVAAANGVRHVVLSTGGRSEEFARRMYPELPEVAFVEMGEFTGVALDHCRAAGIGRASLAGMVGKFAKIAQGHFQTHVAGNRVDMAFLARLAEECGASEALAGAVSGANTARHVQEIVLEGGLPTFFPHLARRVAERCQARVGASPEVEVLLFDFEGALLGRAGRG
jgi:cobalt-precorrin-5B (C1)-methyltransferase